MIVVNHIVLTVQKEVKVQFDSIWFVHLRYHDIDTHNSRIHNEIWFGLMDWIGLDLNTKCCQNKGKSNKSRSDKVCEALRELGQFHSICELYTCPTFDFVYIYIYLMANQSRFVSTKKGNKN